MRKLLFLAGALLAVPVGSWATVELYHDHRYERLCVKHFSDAPICDSGYAADAHRRCAMLDYPPGFIRPPRHAAAKCVQAWLAYEN